MTKIKLANNFKPKSILDEEVIFLFFFITSDYDKIENKKQVNEIMTQEIN
jgi:hypothetical protein